MAPRLLIVLLCAALPTYCTQDDGHFNSTWLRGLLISSHEEGLQTVATAFLHRGARVERTALDFAFRRQVEPRSPEMWSAGEIFQMTLQVLKSRAATQTHKSNVTAAELLSWEDVEQLATLSRCPPAPSASACQHGHLDRYRTVSGLCNNRQNPLWGAANTPLVRWLPAEYEDGETEPKGWNHGRLHNGFQLPAPRQISQKILRGSVKGADPVYSQLLVEWGQYIDHDITFTPQSSASATLWPDHDCLSTCENVHPCFPIQIEDDGSDKERCMPFYRSSAACPLDGGGFRDVGRAVQRQQTNAITSFIDASLVYGHTAEVEASLRDLSGLSGKLATNGRFQDGSGRPYLPSVARLPSACQQEPQGERVECFSAGDSRVSEGLPLTALHTLWLREHNRIAEALKGINPHWNPETIYQETRKIVGALHQIITMRDYVPKILGSESFERHVGAYGGYDPTTNPSASNVFATAAFRFGHATVPPVLRRLNQSFQEDQRFPHLSLHSSFFSPWRIIREGGVEPVLRGGMGTAAATAVGPDLVTDELTERLVVLNVPRHLDLASLNLQRGRDHALPGYNRWRSFCGLKPIRTLSDFKEVASDGRVAEKIFKVYKGADNTDVWLGGLVEKLLPGSRTGPLFGCLIGRQMKALRDGDRFWWEAEGVFTWRQRAELLNGSLSRVVCDNSDIGELPRDVFTLHKFPSGYVSCDLIPSVDLEAWREEAGSGLEDCDPPGTIKNGDFILSSVSGKPVARYSCYHGFKLVGGATIVCEEGAWSQQPPQCAGAT